MYCMRMRMHCIAYTVLGYTFLYALCAVHCTVHTVVCSVYTAEPTMECSVYIVQYSTSNTVLRMLS